MNIRNPGMACADACLVSAAYLYQLVRSANKVQSIDGVELCRDLAAKEPTSPSRADSPSLDVLGITPHEITERAIMRYFLDPLDAANLHDMPVVEPADAHT